MPSRFWRGRGVVDCEREVRREHSDSRWSVIVTDDGDAVVRDRRRRSV